MFENKIYEFSKRKEWTLKFPLMFISSNNDLSPSKHFDISLLYSTFPKVYLLNIEERGLKNYLSSEAYRGSQMKRQIRNISFDVRRWKTLEMTKYFRIKCRIEF